MQNIPTHGLMPEFTQDTIWGFPKIGIPLNHLFIDGFSTINHPFWSILGYPPFMESLIYPPSGCWSPPHGLAHEWPNFPEFGKGPKNHRHWIGQDWEKTSTEVIQQIQILWYCLILLIECNWYIWYVFFLSLMRSANVKPPNICPATSCSGAMVEVMARPSGSKQTPTGVGFAVFGCPFTDIHGVEPDLSMWSFMEFLFGWGFVKWVQKDEKETECCSPI